MSQQPLHAAIAGCRKPAGWRPVGLCKGVAGSGRLWSRRGAEVIPSQRWVAPEQGGGGCSRGWRHARRRRRRGARKWPSSGDAGWQRAAAVGHRGRIGLATSSRSKGLPTSRSKGRPAGRGGRRRAAKLAGAAVRHCRQCGAQARCQPCKGVVGCCLTQAVPRCSGAGCGCRGAGQEVRQGACRAAQRSGAGVLVREAAVCAAVGARVRHCRREATACVGHKQGHAMLLKRREAAGTIGNRQHAWRTQTHGKTRAAHPAGGALPHFFAHLPGTQCCPPGSSQTRSRRQGRACLAARRGSRRCTRTPAAAERAEWQWWAAEVRRNHLPPHAAAAAGPRRWGSCKI